LWLTSAMDAVSAWDEVIWASGSAPRELGGLTRGLIAAYEACSGPVVAVSNELGFGLVPPDPGTRRFRDELGRLNQAFAAAADEVWLVVAGLPLRLK
jgi:adenosylcobinamide kinase/adenosylcobinamide-phosphate guanylyltransferase